MDELEDIKKEILELVNAGEIDEDILVELEDCQSIEEVNELLARY